MGRPFRGRGWVAAGRGPHSSSGHCTGEPLEAKRSVVGLQTVCVLYFGDGWVGDKGRPVIGERAGLCQLGSLLGCAGAML